MAKNLIAREHHGSGKDVHPLPFPRIPALPGGNLSFSHDRQLPSPGR